MGIKGTQLNLTLPQVQGIDAMGRPARICVVGEWLHGLPDEGIHNLAQNLIDQWGEVHRVWAIKIGADLPVNPLFLSLKLRKMLQDIDPDLVFYISPSCAKIGALLRAKMLKAYSSQARVLVIASQPVAYNRFERRLLFLLVPDGIFVQSPRAKELLQGIGCPVYFLPSGVDLERFVPVEAGQKIALRKRYGIDEKALVILHVGHINRNRNIQLLSQVARMEGVQVLLLGSTSTAQDESLVLELTRSNVKVIKNYLPQVEEVYQLADIYLFPVQSEGAAIGVPLSVLEAMACNLPVVCTPFGGLPLLFKAGNGVFYYDSEAELPELISEVKSGPVYNTRGEVEPYAWKNVARNLMNTITSEEALS